MKQYTKLFLSLAISAVLISCSDNQLRAESTKDEIIYTDSRDAEHFPQYVEELKQYARLNGIDEETIKIAFTDVYHIDRVITADRNQPEKKSDLNEYLTRVLSENRLKTTQQKYTEFRSDLATATEQTGVPGNYIVSLWGIESGFGRYQGNEDVISAVSTLAFEGRREKFFGRELLAALTVLERGYITKDKLKGSWAGAMGQSQFMPSSLLAYGKDGDNDGVIDIWNNQHDVFASIGNYLATVGWNAQDRWGNKVNLPKNFDISLTGLDNNKAKTIAQWQKLGVVITDGKLTPAKETNAWVILPDDEPAKAYLVYNNFKTLMNWNRSYYFALSVGLLADSLDTKTTGSTK
ncbi:lytic murein transglycosylase [Zophobihabitans entericus]|uniref:Lytic murein transglycosylase n=1 Tax=Zophobihabitans entericus TaxID=1635327 RepID=A0A6G9IC22_9GAMM|nr:lytic murein transglycosylase [Zophobihabitans entericus]QIQ21763.1 lytic murein transglycosylase [Zophobihabitans entericus]